MGFTSFIQAPLQSGVLILFLYGLIWLSFVIYKFIRYKLQRSIDRNVLLSGYIQSPIVGDI